MTFFTQIFNILFVSGFAIIAFYFYFLRKVFILLKNNYPEKFKELGEPSLWWNNSPRNGINVVRFIGSKDPLFSTDTELRKTKNLALIFLYLGIIIFIILICIVFFAPFNRDNFSYLSRF